MQSENGSGLGHLSEEVRQAARLMIAELKEKRLTVELAPSRVPEVAARGGMIRVVTERNPQWYRELCDEYQKNRTVPRKSDKSDTKIKRSHTFRALREIAAGRCETEYAERLLPYVLEEVAKWRRLEARHRDEDKDGGDPVRQVGSLTGLPPP